MIPQSFIDEVQSRTDIVELVSSYIPLKRTGRNYKALCPFHGEKTPSFIVSSQKQIFHCFGCGEGGGVFQFFTFMEKVSFPEAVEMLAKRVGLVVPYQGGKSPKAKDILYEATKEAAVFFNSNLKNNKDCRPILSYLNKRGIAEKTIAKFQIGYAYGNNTLIKHMRSKGFTLETLEKASLITARKDGFHDLFHERIIFPIFDVRCRVVGFGARIYRETPNSPKYINSLENVLYSKRDHLFGLNFSKEDIAKTNAVIIVEGYLDMIIPFMREVKNIVASLGTALTLEQIRLIKRYASHIILAYDSDKAGKSAVLRSLDLILESGLKVEVVDLPSGYDPDSLVRKKGKDFFMQLLGRRRDFFDHKLECLRSVYDIDSIEGKSKIAKELFVTINKLNSEIEKYEYIKKIAERLGIKEEIAIAEFRNAFPKDNRRTKGWRPYADADYKSVKAGMNKELLPVTEKILLKFMLTSPKAFSLIRKNLKEEYFSSHLARKTVAFLFSIYSTPGDNSTQKLLGTITDKEISGFVSQILIDDEISLDKELLKTSLVKLRKKGLGQLKKELKERMCQAEKEGNRQKVKELIKEYGKIK